MTMTVLTAEQLRCYDEHGAVTVDWLTAEELAQAATAFDEMCPFDAEAEPKSRYRVGPRGNKNRLPQALLDVLQEEKMEAAARAVLRCDRVHFFQTAATASYPQPPEFEIQKRFHIDTQMSLADWEATPRRTICHAWLWLADVTEDRAPIIVHPGSHRVIASEWSKDDDLCAQLPRVHGVDASHPTIQGLLQSGELAPAEPVLARAGQITFLSTGMLHSASANRDPTSARKIFLTTFTASSVHMVLPTAQLQSKQEFDSWLRLRLRPERRHLIAAGQLSTTAATATTAPSSRL
jgi:ectoine hydroxylase-related dioxygenase (phytanoyl-CoA dioxygenase family)